MIIHRNTIWLVPLAIIVTFPLWSVPVGNFLTPRETIRKQAIKAGKPSHDFTMETVKILQNQDGIKTAIIHADSARTDKQSDTLLMDQVRSEIFDAEGNITTIVSKSGTFNSTTEVLTLTEDVVVNKIKDRQFLYTDLLQYHSKERTIHCPGKTRLEGDDVVINGGSLDYDINTSSYAIGNRVHTILYGFDEQEPIVDQQQNAPQPNPVEQ